MAIPPQFLKHAKGKKEAEGKAEPGDSPAEDAAEGDNPFAKKKKSTHHKHKSAADKKKAFLHDKSNKGGF